MSSKRSKKASSQESSAKIEGQAVGNSEEQVPATIVEGTEEQVFGGEEKPPEAATEQTAEKPAPKPKVSKRPYIADVEILLSAPTHTKPQILAFILENYPQVSKGGASTFLTDLMNEKYRHWKDRPVVRTPDGKLVFADRIEAPGPEAVPEAELTKKPGE